MRAVVLDKPGPIENFVIRNTTVGNTPNDVIASDWDLTGMVDDTVLLIRVGRRIANDDRVPEWSPSAAFRR